MAAIDFSNVKSFTPVADGWHDAIVIEAKDGKSKAGNGMWTLTHKIDNPEDPDDGRKVMFHTVVYEGNGAGFALNLLVALGLIEPVGEKVDEKGHTYPVYGQVDVATDDLLGRRLQIKTQIQEYEGKTNAKVVAVRAPQPTLQQALS